MSSEFNASQQFRCKTKNRYTAALQAIEKPWEVSEGRNPPILNRKSATCAVIFEGIS
jgi:hypothetical protein